MAKQPVLDQPNPMGEMLSKLGEVDKQKEAPAAKEKEAPESEEVEKTSREKETVDKEPPESKVEDIQSIDPDSLEFVPKNAKQWKEAKSKFQTRIDELVAQLNDAKTAKEKLAEFGGEEQLKALREENAELKKLTRTAMAERDPELQKRFNTAKSRVVDDLKTSVMGTEAEPLVAIIERRGENSTNDVRKFLTEHPDMDPFVARTLVDAVSDIARLEREKRTIIEESVANWETNIQSHRSAEQERLKQNQSEWQKAFEGEVEAAKTNPFFANEKGEARVALAKQMISGQLTPAESSRLALMGSLYPAVVEWGKEGHARATELQEKLDKIEAGSPGAGAAGGKHGDSSDAPKLPDPRKARYDGSNPWDALTKKLNQAG